ncbi:serine hydrolase [Paenibacillus sp. JCM 10914]|uniref:serine hydrolase domain-containing protein n=1 Tax=Paenibacillus sp. JCM 10914 TaxID=1236974 RepID=UPI00056D84A2|nr:serine hydrolase [Paenibacillus sp. JCM 10914]
MNMNTIQSLPRSTPEQQGISSEAIEHFIRAIQDKEMELHSFMLLRHGQVVAEAWWDPYQAARPHMLFSLSKSFTSTAIGQLAEEGRISVDDHVIAFFPEEAPQEPCVNLAAMTIRDLLMMGTGHAVEPPLQTENWVSDFLNHPVEHEPGTHFVYNSAATYMLSAILQKVTGETLLDYLQPRLLEPLGIDGATWESCPKGIHAGGWGLSIRTEDIAKFGQLYLQLGEWGGRQLVPAAWIKEATSIQIANGPADSTSDWTEGYGYQFWMCRHGAYRGDGAFGQYCIVHPELDAVIAITSGLGDMQEPLNQVWRHLLPAMGPEERPANDEAQASLARLLEGLQLTPPQHSLSSPLESEVAGIIYDLEENEDGLHTFSVRFTEEGAVLNVSGKHTNFDDVSMGRNEWVHGAVRFDTPEDNAACSSMTWRDEQTLILTIRLIETPFYQTAECTFGENSVHLSVWMNESFQGRVTKEIQGKARV